MGFNTKFKHFQSEIECIEQFYRTLNHKRIDIELCPFVGNELPIFLSQRGYCISELNNVSILDLKAYQLLDCVADSFTIREIKSSETREWAKRVALGFDAIEAEDQFFRYVRSNGVSAYAVYDKDVIVAGATLAIHGDFCDLGVTSTLPAYRGKGLTKKIINGSIEYCKTARSILGNGYHRTRERVRL